MAASSQVRYYTGASPGSASGDITGTTIRYKQADAATQDTNNPIPLPASGLNFSWRKSTKINFSTTPAGTISNLRWFLATLPGTGVRFFARLQVSGIYIQAISNDATGITGFTDTSPNQTTNDAVNYISAAPLTVLAGTLLTNPNTGEGGVTQLFVETQLALSTAYVAGPGVIASFQATYRYSET